MVLARVPRLTAGQRLVLAGIVAVGAVLRVAWATQVRFPRVLADPFFYVMLGGSLADGHGYAYPSFDPVTGLIAGYAPTAYYPPGYPLFLGGVFRLADTWPGEASRFGVAVAANVVLSVALVGLVFALGRRLAGPVVGLAAGAVTALWPNLVFHSGVALTETLFLCLFVLMMLVALATPEVARHPGRRRLLVMGVLVGLVILVRPVSVVVAPLLLILWWSDGVGAAARRMTLVAGATVAVLAPWAILSTDRMNAPVLVSLNVGDNLCIGYHDGADGSFELARQCTSGFTDLDRPEYETRRQSANIGQAFTYIRNHPGDVVALIPPRAGYTLLDDHDGLAAAEDYGAHPLFRSSTRAILGRIADAYYVGVLGLAAVGIIVIVRRGLWSDRRWQFLVLSAPVQLLSPLLTFGDPRFKMPIYPAVATCAGAAIAVAARAGLGPAPVRDQTASPGTPEVTDPAVATEPRR